MSKDDISSRFQAAREPFGMEKYSEDQPRDEHGRFGSGGGDKSMFDRHTEQAAMHDKLAASAKTPQAKVGHQMAATAHRDAAASHANNKSDRHEMTGRAVNASASVPGYKGTLLPGK